MTMTTEEIMSFQGHEFTYVFPDKDTMPAYIKKIDIENKLMSWWGFSLITDNAYELAPKNDEEEFEEASCLGYADSIDEIISLITEIKETGKIITLESGSGFFEGCPF